MGYLDRFFAYHTVTSALFQQFCSAIRNDLGLSETAEDTEVFARCKEISVTLLWLMGLRFTVNQAEGRNGTQLPVAREVGFRRVESVEVHPTDHP